MQKQTRNYIYSIEMVGMTIALLVLAVALFLPIGIFNRELVLAAGLNPFFIIGMVFWFILHELIHGFSYRLSRGVRWSDIAFGAQIEKGILFCVTEKPISKTDTIRSLLAPLIVIGILTLIVGLVFNLELLIVLSLMNICGAMGDILMTLFILKMPKDMRYLEDNRARFVIITGEDISEKKALGVKLSEIEDDFEKLPLNHAKKVNISLISGLIIAALCVYTVLALLGIF